MCINLWKKNKTNMKRLLYYIINSTGGDGIYAGASDEVGISYEKESERLRVGEQSSGMRKQTLLKVK